MFRKEYFVLKLFSHQHWVLKVLAHFVLLIGLCVANGAQAYTGVTIVMATQTPANLEFVDNFRMELISAKNNSIRVKVVMLDSPEKLTVAENSELVIALGVKALEAASILKHTTPVLGVYTPLPVFNKLLDKSKRELGNFSAIVLDQPYWRQLALIKAVLPETKKVGVLFGPTSSQYLEVLREEADELGLSLMDENVSQEAELIPKLKKLLDSSDALLAIPDRLIYSRESAESILLTSYRHQKPMFGYSQSYVKAGALASVYSSTKQLAKQAAEIAIRAQAAPSQLPSPQVPKYYSVTLNSQVAHSLSIAITDEETVYKKMQANEAAEAIEIDEKKH
jgi:putative tryptophan/tyrosine transport system substrate-binding protein